MAIGALRELNTARLRVPQDMSVIGFDDISFAALAEPPLTTILIPRSEIGENAVEALMHTIQAADNLGREFNVSAQLVVRESTGAGSGATRKRQVEEKRWLIVCSKPEEWADPRSLHSSWDGFAQ
jgi:hypothetical protein